MHPALPPETGILPSVAPNTQPSSPFYPTDGPCGRPASKPATPAHPSPLQPFCTAHSHLRAVCPAARIHHQTIIYCSQLVQNRILHFNTRPEYLPASPSHAKSSAAPIRRPPSPYVPASAAAKSSIQALYAAAKHSDLELPAGVSPSKLRIARSLHPGHHGMRQPRQRRLRCKGPQRRAKAGKRPPWAVSGPAGDNYSSCPAASVQSSGSSMGEMGSGVIFGEQKPFCKQSQSATEQPCMAKIRLFIQGIEHGARNGWCVSQSQTARSCYALSFLRRKDFRNPIMIRPRQPIQQANHWPPNHPPHPPGSYQPCIAALEDIICLLFGHSSTAQPPGKAAHLPCLQSIQLFNPNLHIISVLSAYVSAMVCV